MLCTHVVTSAVTSAIMPARENNLYRYGFLSENGYYPALGITMATIANQDINGNNNNNNNKNNDDTNNNNNDTTTNNNNRRRPLPTACARR
jgi:hypothetical protein